MKIHARSSKKLSPPHPETANFIAAILRASTAELPDILRPIDVWAWPRSDLHWWIQVLNKFDTVLEEIIREYEIDKLQVNSFSLLSKNILLSILTFEKLMLENSTNRKLFNSYDRLSSLLFSSDLDVVVADLQLLLRPAQQYSAQASLSHALNISASHLQALAKRWPNIRENGLELVDLASEKKEAEVEALPAEASEVNHTFYRKPSSEVKTEGASSEGDGFTSQQRKQNASLSAPVVIHLGSLAHSSKSAINILAETIESYSVPNDEKFELFSKIRAARSLGKGRREERVKLVIIRLLAIAVFCLTQNEGTAQSSIFLYEPDLIAQVAELLHLDRGISVAVQTAAIAALDAMGRYRSKIQELLTAVNAGVNHGILMSLLRKTVTDIANPQSTLPNTFVETLISFVTFIASHASGGNMLVAAGLIPMLIQIIENTNAARLSILSKTMQLVDNIAYGFPNAFQLFCNAHGVDAVVKRIEYEVNLDVEVYLDRGGLLSFTRASVLKHTLRTLHRMMQTSGTAESLRGLIDSSLIQSIKKIIEHRSLFGASVLPIAIHVMATFVHNEPTSLGVLQEAKLPGVFYQGIEDHIEPSIEVIQAIINAIGALCLNQMGLEQLTSRPNIIPSIFSMFTSERHLKVLSEKENAAIFGTAVDELIRHHPTLKDSIFAAISTVFQKMEEIGQGLVDNTEAESHYRLVLVGDAERETTMDVADVAGAERPDAGIPEAILEGEQSKQEPVDNIVVTFVDVMSRFLEGVFQHAPHCRDFVSSTDCLDRLSKIITLPCIPYNYGSSIASDSLVQILRAMTEVAPAQTINKVINHVRVSLDETRSFWSTTGGQSKLLRYVEPSTPEALTSANVEFRKLVSLLTHITILADVFSSYAHSRSALNLVPSLLAEEASGVLSDLGALHRACIWENIALKSVLVRDGLLPTRVEKSSSVESSTSTSQTVDLLNESGTLATTPGTVSGLTLGPEQKLKETSDKETPRQRNAKALKHISTEIPTSLTPLFQAVVRLPSMYSRRNPDVAQKRQILLLSEQMAKIVLGHLQLEALDESPASYAYSTVMIGLLILLVYEERSSQSTVNTVLLVALNKVGAITALLTVCHRYACVPEQVFVVKAVDPKEEQNQELIHAFGGLKVAFQLLYILVSSKPLLDSPQTALMTTRDKKDTDPDYFEAQDFVVRLRNAILPFVREVWEAQWLLSAPINLCKYVVQTILELLAAENEESKGDPSAEFAAAMTGVATTLPRQHLPPDENGISRLCDMGFPRGAATRALTRMRNNVAAAAEYLLSQPFPLPVDPEEPAQEEIADGDNSPSEADEQINEASNDTGMVALESAEVVATPAEDSPADKGKGPETSETEVTEMANSEQRRAELNEGREPIKENLGRRALQLLDEHPSLIFDVKGAFVGSAEGYSSRTLPLIIQDIKDFSPGAYGVHEQSLAVRCRLLALVLNEVGSLESRLNATVSKELMDVLVALLLAHPTNTESGMPIVPKWLATHLLVTEALLVAGDEPKTITIPGEDEEIIPRSVSNEPSYSDARGKLFQLCLKFLVNTELSHDELIAVMRLIVYLSREYSIARELVKLGGVHSLLERFRRLSKEANGCQIYVVLILRHVAEDQSSLDIFMTQEVRRWFSTPRTKVSEISSFIRGSVGIVMRDPKTFLRVTESLCQLVQPHPSVYQITLKPSRPASDKKEQDGKANDTDEMQVDEPPAEIASNDTLEFMMQYIIGELMRVGKAAMQGCGITAQGTDKSTTGEIPNEPGVAVTVSEEEARGDHSYACFLMQCLTELLFSYNSCKLALLNYSKKKSATAKEATPKHRPTVLNFLLSELTSFGTLDPVGTPASKRRVVLCNLSMSVMAALCLNIPEYNDGKDYPADLVTVRRVVLDTVGKAIRDPLPSESIEERYGRLLALSDLCHRFLTVKAGYGPSHKPQDDGPLHMAKLMLEKNYVATLTNALAEVDLNYPNVRVLVASILRPLEHLSKIAIKMGRVADKGKDKDSGDLESEPVDENDSEEEEEREETPDLYRNSSLGIYSGEMDDGNNYDSDDEMGEDDEVGDEVDMEYGEEDTSGSENTSLDSEVEDAEHAHLHAEGEEGWQDEEDEDEMDDDDEDEGEGDMEDGDINDDVEDHEITWQDVTGTGLEEDGQVNDMDEEEILEGMPATDDAEDDLVSEVEELADIGILEHTGLTPSDGENAVGQWFGELAIGRDGHHHFFPGPPRPRRTAHDLAIFGAPRNAASGAPETVTHPLLVDPSNSGGILHPHSRGPHRRVNRGNPAASNYTDLLQTIEDLVSGGALQLFQQLMSVGRGGASELHIDLGPIGGGHHLIPAVDRNAVHRHGARATLFAAPRSDRPNRSADQRPDVHEFGPLPTHQRWVEEAKIAHGKFLMERVGKISNYVTLALLPAAREAAKLKQKLKEQEEEERHKHEEVTVKAGTDAQAMGDTIQHEAVVGSLSGDNIPVPDVSTARAEEEDAIMEDATIATEQSATVEDTVAEMEGVTVNDMEPPTIEPSTNTGGSAPAAISVPTEVESSTNDQQENAEAGPSTASVRVTVMVHGNPVDITDTGIDPTFLEALPDDMREEVLNQHFRERRIATQDTSTDSQISREFLDALPAELQAEILAQERSERAQVQATTAGQNTAPTGPADIDPASFLASLDPQLRQVVLMDQEDGFLQTLPSHLIAEATTWRDHRSPSRVALDVGRGPPHPEVAPRRSFVQRDAIQLLDKNGLATLVRLLFFPQLSRKSLLLKVFVNLCENSKTRAELLNLLLNILQDGTGDLAAVDKSFAQLSFKSRPSVPSQITPKPTKGKSTLEVPSTPNRPWQAAAENIPNLIVQRSLEALTFIVSANELASRFFLTEHEVHSGLKRSLSRKGKGKEKQASVMQYPIVPLFALLDRQALLKPTMMDSLAALLAIITRPLTSLKDKKEDAAKDGLPAEQTTVTTDESNTTHPSVSATAQSTTQLPPVAANEPSSTVLAVPAAAVPSPAPADTTNTTENNRDQVASGENSQLKVPPLQVPSIPASSLHLIVNILTVGECSGRTFQSTLALIQHLSFLPDARDTIAMELRSKAQGLGHSIYNDLDELVAVLERDDAADEVPATISAKFSPASSDQAKLLRVLKTIDYMYSNKSTSSAVQAPSSSESESKPSDKEKVTSIYESFHFASLWRRLGDCLAIVEQKPDVEHMATVLLPLIESLMVVCKYVGPQSSSSRALQGSTSPRSPTTSRESMEDLFTSFTDTHRKVLNLMVRNNPSLMSGSFSLLVQNPRVLDFDNKRNYFYQQLRRRPHSRENHGTLQLNVRRQRVFEDSFQYLQRRSGEQIKYGKLSVRFYDEEGVDAGGVTREWFQILARQMFNPNYALFQPCAADKLTYQPNRASWVNPEHLSFFKFVGRIIGKAIFDNRLLEAYFARSLYRQLLGKPVDHRDVEWVDPEYYNSLVWILENDPTPLELTFSTEADEFGVTRLVELKENGASIPVTQENKREFVQLSADYRLTKSIKDQIEALLGGFYDIIPKDLISIFNEKEVELLISGTPDIDIDEWRAATEYNGYTSSDPVIVWWWRALKSFNRDERAKVLSFATGTSRVPLGGFTELQGVQGVQKFSIHKAYGNPDRLPQAHTCFNQIDLPQYSSYDKLRQQLLLAINEGGEGFGFA